jgi:hypothetical protein
VLLGRPFTDSDGAAGKPFAIVNKRFAAKYWPKEDPLGKKIHLFRGASQPLLTVVGVAPDILQNDPNRVDLDPIVYIPFRQDPLAGAVILTRTKVEPNSLIAPLRKELRGVDETVAAFGVRTMEERMIQMRWPFRVFGSMFAIFAFIALMLAGVGIYAVMAYSISRRTQEIGVRMALGATTGSVMRLALRQGMRQLALGVALGLAAAFGVTRVLQSLLMRISPTDPVTFTAISILLCAIGTLACWIPARRATLIDPVVALRNE